MKNEECFAGMVARMVAGTFAATVGATLVVARPVSVHRSPKGANYA